MVNRELRLLVAAVQASLAQAATLLAELPARLARMVDKLGLQPA